MSVPEYVERARDADERYRNETSDAYWAEQDAKPRNVTPLRHGWLGVVPLGRSDLCPQCGLYIPVCDLNNGWHLRECSDCQLVMESQDD